MCSNTLTGVQKDNVLIEINESEEANVKIVCERRCDEGVRFFKDNVCGTIRTIDGGGAREGWKPMRNTKVVSEFGN